MKIITEFLGIKSGYLFLNTNLKIDEYGAKVEMDRSTMDELRLFVEPFMQQTIQAEVSEWHHYFHNDTYILMAFNYCMSSKGLGLIYSRVNGHRKEENWISAVEAIQQIAFASGDDPIWIEWPHRVSLEMLNAAINLVSLTKHLSKTHDKVKFIQQEGVQHEIDCDGNHELLGTFFNVRSK